MAWISLLRRPAAALAAAALMLTFLACGGGSTDGGDSSPATPTVTITVKVNYTRIPVLTDASGIPTGLETNTANFKNLPARGVQVRLWVAKEETALDGTKTRVWTSPAGAATDSTGTVTFTTAPKDTDAFVEVLSILPTDGSRTLRIVGDPAGVNSSLPVGERPFYALRRGLDGSAPAGNPLPAGKASATATLTFDVGLADKWWLTLDGPDQLSKATQETTGTGSRVLAILDSIYAFSASGLGSSSPGAPLDLHYRMGVSDARGTFVEYDRTRFPLAYDGNLQILRYFGSIRGSQANDDAFDEGILLVLCARNGLWATGVSPSFPTGQALPDYTLDACLLDALPFAMAASVQKSPYIADTAGGGATYRDVRSLGAQAGGAHSAAAVAALAWDLALKAQSLPSPGTPADWTKLDPKTLARFYVLTLPTDTKDVPSVFGQMALLKEPKLASEPVDLAAIFTDAVLTGLAAPHTIPWPRPASGPSAPPSVDWGTDPNSLATPLAPFSFSMAKAVQADGRYPNSSSDEVRAGIFTLDKDVAYNLKVTTVPATLPAGTVLELLFTVPNTTFRFSGSTSSPTRIVLRGLTDTPVLHKLRARVLSPEAAAPDFTATIALEQTN